MTKTFCSTLVAAGVTFLLGYRPALADVFNMPIGQKNLEFVTVSDPGNAPDTLVREDGTTGYGSVGSTYQIGKYEVTAAQYCKFLNAVAVTDTYGLYNSYMAPGYYGPFGINRSGSPGSYSYTVAVGYDNVPISYETWGSAARFCNWLENGQPTGAQVTGTTEDGAYTLNGATTHAVLREVTRNAGAKYVIPNENEWYKAGFYKGGGTDAGYWLYPTQSNAVPSNVLSTIGTNNANWYHGGYTDPTNYLTTVGAFAACPGRYGTFDMSGNVYEWTETASHLGNGGKFVLGGAFYNFGDDEHRMPATYRGAADTTLEFVNIGFRVASVNLNSWKGPGGGNYDLASNWTNDIVPNGVDVTASFLENPTSISQVTLNSDVTLGAIIFNSTHRYILKGTPSLILQASSGQARVKAQNGSHSINVPVVLQSDTIISGAGNLSLNGGIGGPHRLIVLSTMTATSIQVDTLTIGSTGAMVVPEPSAIALFGMGAIGLLAYAWRRRKWEAQSQRD